MRTVSISLSMLALALLAGCAEPRTTEMGAGPSSQQFVCRDGAHASNSAVCGDHGGVERQMNISQ